MRKKTKIFLLISFLVITIFSFPSDKTKSQEVYLETNYPAIPGNQTTRLVITPNSKIGDIVKYYFSWVIILGTIVAFLSLVAGGILFISSIGNPSALQIVKERIYKSLLGLLILLASYIILHTINPKLTALKLERKAVIFSVAFMTEEGFEEFSGANNKDKVLDVLNDPQKIRDTSNNHQRLQLRLRRC